MQVTALDIDTLASTVSDNRFVIVDFWASWCGPCLRFSPLFADASERHADVFFGSVDAEMERDVAAAVGVSSLPTVVAYRDGTAVFHHVGALSPLGLDRLADSLRSGGAVTHRSPDEG